MILPAFRGHCAELGLAYKIYEKGRTKKAKSCQSIYWQIYSEVTPSWKRQWKEDRQNSSEETYANI